MQTLNLHDGKQRTIADVHLLLQRGDGAVLFSQRRGGYGDGEWHVPAGKLEAGESLEAAAIREAKEELGVTIRAADLQLVHTAHAATAKEPRLGFFFHVHRWTGAPTNQEPDKCHQLTWGYLDELPDPFLSGVDQALRAWSGGASYSSIGW